MTKEDHYEVLDAILTELVEKGGVEITSEIEAVLLRFNRELREALGLTN